jgi:hypothetical protein
MLKATQTSERLTQMKEETALTTPTPQELLADPCTPFWAKDVIRVALTKDCCDVAGVFEVLSASFNERARKFTTGGR